jgi:RNA polymerase sigma-70 factor (ECF subfamily)
VETDVVALIPALRAFARTFYRDVDDADDLVQEVLTRALSNIHQFRPGTALKSWLFTIMRNAFYTRIRKSTRETPGAADCVSDRPSTPATQEWSSRAREIHSALQKLPDQQREVVVLIGVLGVSYEEAAEICGCAIGTIKSRLNRARATLVEALGEESTRTSVQSDENFPIAAPVNTRNYG